MDVDDDPPVPLPTSGGIQDLREKLHAKMASLRRGGARETLRNRDEGDNGADEAGSKDELIEERRRQRAIMRERRRKETKEKIRKQEEERRKKGKGREKDQGNQSKVRACQSKTECHSLILCGLATTLGT